MDKLQLGNRIRAARKEAGLTSERLSEICDINAAYLRQIECGTKTPSLPLFVLLCKGLQVTPSYLLADTLPGCDNKELDALLKICTKATPQQINMIVSVLNAFVPFLSAEQNT